MTLTACAIKAIAGIMDAIIQSYMQLGYILVVHTTRWHNYGTCIYSILRNSTISKAQKAKTERNGTRREDDDDEMKRTQKGKRNQHKIAKSKNEN